MLYPWFSVFLASCHKHEHLCTACAPLSHTNARSPTEAADTVAAAASATGLPTVLVKVSDQVPAASSATGAATASVARLALPKIAAGQDGSVSLAGFSTKQPINLEITPKCVAAAKDGVAVGSFTPPANATPVRTCWGWGGDCHGALQKS